MEDGERKQGDPGREEERRKSEPGGRDEQERKRKITFKPFLSSFFQMTQ